MSVIISRALPEVRDGLKPVQRRILYAMQRAGATSGTKTKKSAAFVGDVMKLYHPHGDSAIYDALVRMAQPFSLRYPLIDGQGNFGSDDDDPAAAMRYTEMRLSRIGEVMLRDIGKDTVPLVPTYKQDAKVVEPYYLPARIPPAVNGQEGVGLGFATRVPPHNLREILYACIALLDQPQMGVLELMNYVKGPDFPSGGTIVGDDGIRVYLATGRGRVVHRGTVRLEEDQRGRRILSAWGAMRPAWRLDSWAGRAGAIANDPRPATKPLRFITPPLRPLILTRPGAELMGRRRSPSSCATNYPN